VTRAGDVVRRVPVTSQSPGVELLLLHSERHPSAVTSVATCSTSPSGGTRCRNQNFGYNVSGMRSSGEAIVFETCAAVVACQTVACHHEIWF
jgi:hypothetical protein